MINEEKERKTEKKKERIDFSQDDSECMEDLKCLHKSNSVLLTNVLH